MLSLFIVPIISKEFGYGVGLSLSAIAMFCALVFFMLFNRRFSLADNRAGKNGKHKLSMSIGLFAVGMLVAYIAGYVLKYSELSKWLMLIGSIIFIALYLAIAFKLPKYETKGMLIGLVLLLQSVLFWILYIQTSTTFVLFAYHNINLNILGYDIPAGATQMFNGFYIVVLSPILANIYLRFYNKGFDIGIPYKFAYGMLVNSICFFVLAMACSFFANAQHQISVLWLFIAYGFCSLAELLISAIGPSMVAKLLPKRIGGFAQGIWYLTLAIGMKIGGIIASFAASEYTTASDAAKTLAVYNHLFYEIGIIVLVVSIVILIIAKPLTRNMQQVLKHRT